MNAPAKVMPIGKQAAQQVMAECFHENREDLAENETEKEAVISRIETNRLIAETLAKQGVPDSEIQRLLRRDNPLQESKKDEEFDWKNDESIILKHQPATAIYENVRGGITIRQEAGMYDDEDHFITLTPSSLDTFKTALNRIKLG